jgi:hypothetical protein
LTNNEEVNHRLSKSSMNKGLCRYCDKGLI